MCTGFRPKYLRSRVALQTLRETIGRYIAAQDAQKALAAREQAAKSENDEFSRLGQMDVVDDFYHDQPISTGELEGEPARHQERAKGTHRREGAAHVFHTWRQEFHDTYDLGDLMITGRIRATGVKFVQDNTMTADMAAQVLQNLDKVMLVKMKFVCEQVPDVRVVEDGFDPLKEGGTRGGGVLEISSRTELEGIDRFYFQDAYPVTEVVYGLYPHQRPKSCQPCPDAQW